MNQKFISKNYHRVEGVIIMTRKRFIKLCMVQVNRNTAMELASKVIREYKTYANAYAYFELYPYYVLDYLLP